MRNFFIGLTIILILIGFMMPLAWIGAIFTAILALASRPPGLRPDGKRRSGGLFGGIIDHIAISSKMRDCPFCKTKIMKKAQKCPNCGEWVKSLIKICPHCGRENRSQDYTCIHCSKPLL